MINQIFYIYFNITKLLELLNEIFDFNNYVNTRIIIYYYHSLIERFLWIPILSFLLHILRILDFKCIKF